MSQKYVIAHFIDLASIPNEFHKSEWPLHVTLLAIFRIPQLEVLEKELAIYSQQTKTFDISVEGEDLFGPKKNVAVSLIRPDKSIMEVHNRLLSIASRLGAIFDEPAFTGNGFRPHATIQTGSHLTDKQTISVGDFTLVDMYPNNDINQRRIIKTYKLSG